MTATKSGSYVHGYLYNIEYPQKEHLDAFFSISFPSLVPFSCPSTYPYHLASASRICFFSLSSLECFRLASSFSSIPLVSSHSMLHLSFSAFTYPAHRTQEASGAMQCNAFSTYLSSALPRGLHPPTSICGVNPTTDPADPAHASKSVRSR